MTKEIRWRILTLQGVLTVVLAFAAGFLFSTSAFVTGYVHDELVAQKISFPPASVLAAAEYNNNAEIRSYAGQQLDNGAKAQVYANDFIAVHISNMKPYNTYAAASGASMANPKDASLAALTNTLFKGETLRSMLLNAWGWSQMAMYAFYGAIAISVAAAVVFIAFMYELVVAPRREGVVVTAPRTKAAVA